MEWCRENDWEGGVRPPLTPPKDGDYYSEVLNSKVHNVSVKICEFREKNKKYLTKTKPKIFLQFLFIK